MVLLGKNTLKNFDMNDLDTLESLKTAADAIEQRNSYWKSSQDGSYELALEMSGYYKIREKIRALESELNIVRGYN